MTTLFFSVSPSSTLEEQLDRLHRLPPLKPFSDEAKQFVADFSRRILALPQLREHPELATLAHWFRPAAQEQLARRIHGPANEYPLARGLVFHLAPANVDVLFAYAWLMSVLVGNRNVARLSQKASTQRDALVSILFAMHEEGLHPEVLARSVLLTYPHDDTLTTQISKRCHARIIWGGDTTVGRIRSLPLAPLAVELAFPDRFGVAVVNAAEINRQDDATLKELGRRFNNDVLWFGQQACSSPRTLYWIGEHDEAAAARQRFWSSVRSQANDIADEPAALMARVTDAHLMAAMSPGLHVSGTLGSYPMTLETNAADHALRELQSGYGLVVESVLPTLSSLAGCLDDRDQTLVQYGFDRQELAMLLDNLGNRAIDRIVPFGRALDFHPIWDGTDLLDILTRKVTLPGA